MSDQDREPMPFEYIPGADEDLAARVEAEIARASQAEGERDFYRDEAASLRLDLQRVKSELGQAHSRLADSDAAIVELRAARDNLRWKTLTEPTADTLRALLAEVDGFNVGADPNALPRRRIEKRRGRDGVTRWAVVAGKHVADATGAFEYEPLPSSRDDEFLARTRFTLDEACNVALKVEGVSAERVERVRTLRVLFP